MKCMGIGSGFAYCALAWGCYAHPPAQTGVPAYSALQVREAVVEAYAGARIDSLCQPTGCGVLLVDTLVRIAPSIGPYQLERLPISTWVSITDLLAVHASPLQLVSAEFRAANGDSASIGFAVVLPDQMNGLTVLIPIEFPTAFGALVIIDMEQRANKWQILRVDVIEG